MRSEQIKQYIKRVEAFLGRLHRDGPLISKAPLEGSFFHSSKPVPFADRLECCYEPITTARVWGAEWDSAWFHITGTIPAEWRGSKVVARLDFNGEACVFDRNGRPLWGLTSGSVFAEHYGKDLYHLPPETCRSEKVELWIEAAANGLFGINLDKDPHPRSPARHGSYEGRVVAMELALFNEELWGLMLDAEVLFSLFCALNPNAAGETGNALWGTAKTLPQMTPRARRLLFLLNQAIDVYGDDHRNAAAAREVLREPLASGANASDAVAVSVGHAHIDTGWLWPVRETIRKCGRTFASQIALMEKYPDYVFGASQPQHYQFVKTHYPVLYEDIKKYVKKGNWELQGGMWVEADCNIISGESMVRQFLHGKNFFMDEFGCDVRNLWIPDVFGYSVAMPQIMQKAGIEFFLTQKISWSQFNEFPHNTFRWRGIDGSEVVVHFPPEDSYNSPMLPRNQIKAQNSFKEGHFLDQFMSLYGIGNGGGGPKEEHIERARRMADLEGCPKVKFGRSDAFFARLSSRAGRLPVWDGELYLELHRGTLTTQARTKKGNRRLERKLREVEFVYSALPPSEYPAAELDRLWKTLLLNQFHDILPGSSIHRVYEVAEKEYADSLAACERLIGEAADHLQGRGKATITLVNSLSTAFRGAVELPPSWHGTGAADARGRMLPVHLDSEGAVVMVDIPACSALTIRKSGEATAAPAPADAMVLENGLVRYELGNDGTVLSAFDKELRRQMLRPGAAGNLLSLYVDRPANWDAWDIDISYENELVENARGVAVTPLGKSEVRQGVKFRLEIGDSRIEQKIYLHAGSKRLDFHTTVEWNERHRMLRVSFPSAVRAREATCDIQFGFVRRPTHRNTGWDMAKFEVAAHKYADISNDDFGLALLNDCKYGYNIHEGVLDLNLLRSPTHPDADADRGVHSFRYALLPHRGMPADSGVVEEAQKFNYPPIMLAGVAGDRFKSPVGIDGEGVALAALKKAEKEDCTVVRLVESHGRHSTCRLNIAGEAALTPCDLLEWHEETPLEGRSHALHFKPFEIKTFKIREK